MYWLASVDARNASPRAALKRDCSISPPTVSKAAATPSRTPRSSSVSSPAAGISPKLRYAFVSVLLTRLPQLASSSSLLRRTNSGQLNDESCVSGPAAVR